MKKYELTKSRDSVPLCMFFSVQEAVSAALIKTQSVC
jgi:hypothetical protein